MRKFTILLVAMLFCGLQVAFAQKTITGTVTSAEDGTPLIGVTVIIKGTTIGTTTDLDGKYSIEVPDDTEALLFSYVGMSTQEIAIGNRTVINVELAPSAVAMDEIVVTALGISREKKALGYAVQEVSGDELARSGAPNIVNSLAGKVSSVQVVNSSGAAGGASFITIRGAASITQNNQPLFVVDGVPIDNGGGGGGVGGVALSNRAIDLNPDDIESVSVLKGGAATVLYGLRAANGAIIITTKKGKPTTGKKINVSLSSSVSIDMISQVPKLNTKYAQGWGGQWSSGNFASWGPRIDTLAYSKDPSVWTKPGFDTEGAIVSANSPLANAGPVQTFDQFDFFQTGLTFSNTLALTGGNQNSNFYISLSDLESKGVIPNNKFNKNTFKISGESKLSDKFTMGGSVNYIISSGDRIQQGSNTSGVMLGLMRTPPTFNNEAGYEFPDGSQRNYRAGGGYDNPYWTANKNLYHDQVNRMIGNVNFTYEANDWLSFTYRLGIDWYNRKHKDQIAINSRTSPAGLVQARNGINRDINSDFLVHIKKNITEDIKTNITLGQNMTELYSYWVQGQANGLSIPMFYNISNTDNIAASESTTKIRRAGVFADIGLSYRSLIFVNITGRNDWSTTLPEENNSFFYPSFSGGFVFTELPAFDNMENWLSFGKLRGSYAVVALDAPAYWTRTYYSQVFPSDGWVSPSGIQFPFNGYNGFTLNNTKGNPELKPETTKSFEIGLEMRFFMNRLGFDIAYFNNQGEDLLLPVDIDPASGFGSEFVNAATMESKGIELVLTGQPFKTKSFAWDVMVNFSKIDNTVLSLAENVDALFLGGFTDPQIRAVAGEKYKTIYGYDWVRNANGDVIIGENGYPTGDYNMVPLGTVDPDWIMGITNNFSYKNFNLSFLIDIKQGGQMWNGTRGALYYFGAHADTENRDEQYIFEGVDENGNVNTTPAENGVGQWWRTSGEGSGFTGPTVDYIEDANWVRLRELTLSYSFDSKLLSKTFIENLNVYFTGRNLWLSTPYTGIDPETSLLGADNAQGMDYFNMPGTKTFIFGVKANF